jgi:CheY-like chemotaxis protein
MKNIVVVDDDHDLLFTIKSLIEYSGKNYDLKTFNSGIKCLEHLNHETPDIIFIDIMMPEMNGWELIHKIRQLKKLRDIPIIFISSVADDTSKRTAYEIADDFIEKPFTQEIFLDKIEKMFNKK